MIDLTSLNENQLKSVEWSTGPLLVLAGPGSGKTRVLTYRIARLLATSDDERFRILGITFTNKAAAEMRQRLDELISEGRERALLTTFHSFAAELLRQHGSHIGLQPDFAIQSQIADRQAVLADAIRAVGTRDEDLDQRFSVERLLPVIDGLLDAGVARDEARDHIDDHHARDFVVAVYDKYFEHLIAANQMDFGTLIVCATTLLKRHAGVAKQVRRIYTHVCVDEFQDTNAAQYELLIALVPQANPNLFIVADDDQLIYQWNGASPERLSAIRQRFEMHTIQLPQNYRCPKEVIDLANLLIAHNLDRAPDKQDLTTSRAASAVEVVRVEAFADLAKEVAWLRADILARATPERAKCVVLARTKKMLEAVVQDFTANGLPAHVSVRKTEFLSAPLRWMHAALRLGNARTDREQVRRLCKAFFELEGLDLRVEEVVGAASLNNGDLLRAWLDAASRREALSPDAAAVLGVLRDRLLERGDFDGFTKGAFSWFEKLKTIPGSAPPDAFAEYDDEAACWRRLTDEICAELGRSEVTLSALLQGLDLRSKELPAPDNAVLCFTIHTAKGMEFEHVYLLGMAEDQLPSWAAVKKGDDSLEMREERRNCFVAITRTRSSLTMTYAKSYNGWAKQPSRFLHEMGLEHS